MNDLLNACRICSVPEGLHRQNERKGLVQHQHTLTGDLVPVDRSPRAQAKPRQPAQIIVAGAIDLPLRQLLYTKGILTDDDLAALQHVGLGLAGDRDPGEASSAD